MWEKLNRRRFMATATAWSAAGSVHPMAAAMFTADGGDAARVKAVADWMKEDAAAAERAGLKAEAEAQRAELQGALSTLSGMPAPQHGGLFPKVATPRENPALYVTLLQVDKLAKDGKTYLRGSNAETKDLGVKSGYPYITIAQEGVLLAHAFGDRQSPFFGDPSLIAPMLRRFRASYEILTPGSKHLQDFGSSPHLSEMYCLFKAAFPGLLPASVKGAFETGLRTNAEAILDHVMEQGANAALPADKQLPETTREQIFLHPVQGNCYPNSDAHYMVALLFTGMALKDERMLKAASAAVELMGTAIYPDGGTAYIGFQNECLTYHGIMINDLARYWQVTGDTRALSMVKDTRWYYPLAITPQAVAEYSSAPCWKHYWNGVKGTNTAAMIASLMDCGYNAQVGENDKLGADWLLATIWKPVAKAKWWDNAITYDASIQGARGRYGNYSFSATSRNTLEESRGKENYVGSLIVQPGATESLNAALDGVWAEMALKPQNDARTGGERFHGHACLSRKERTAYTVTPEFAAVSSLYRLSEYGRQPLPLAGRQMWLLSPERIVGRVEVECLEDQQGFGLGAAVRMVCGRGDKLPSTQWSSHANMYQYGPYTVRLWPVGGEADLAGSANRVAGYMGVFGDSSDKSGLLVLHDSRSRAGDATPTKYSKGERYFAVVEIYPRSNGGAKSVSMQRNDEGLLQLEVVEKNQRLLMLHNTGSVATRWVRAADLQGAVLHREGETCRLGFLPPVKREAAVAAGEALLLQAGEHAVLRLA